MRRRQRIALAGIVAVCAVGVGVLVFAGIYAAMHLPRLQSEAMYASPEEGMLGLIQNSYSGIKRVEIVSADRLYRFDDLWFVIAHVWAEKRSDGGGFHNRDYDNPGCFFLKIDDGWVFVPEGKAEIIALGKHLFRLSG